MQTLLSA